MRARVARWWRAAGLILPGLLVARGAGAQLIGKLAPSYNPDDPYQVPDAPAPPSLPDLTHRGVSLGLTSALGRITPLPRSDGTSPGAVGVWLQGVSAEVAVSNRRWYLGISELIAAGQDPEGKSTTVVASNPEIWGRALWASRAGLAYGGGLGFLPPLVRHDADSAKAAVQANVRLVRPWDFPHFADRTMTFRPFIDVRSLDRSVMLQLRQGLDLTMLTSEVSATRTPDTDLTSRTTFYIGYRPAERLGLGLELSEVYFIKAPGVEDGQRAVFSISPSVRWMGEVLQPAASLLVPVGKPLFHQARDYWAIQLGLEVIVDPNRSRPLW